ncbi:MAG: Flp pilus assembly protein CpaB [Deltaproteobacteria bacterium]|nr:Flp pilus assembly protein CpaB [Deltaproteobacteria bacterium]
MDNRRAVAWSLTAALIGVISFWLYVNKAVDREIGDLKIRQKILRAARDIPANTRIDQSMFVEADYPASFVPPKAAQNPSEVVGQVAIATIFESEPILISKLVPFDESSLDRRIPEGYRAVTIGIRDDQDVIGVGGLLRPGHFVDILLMLFVNTKEIEKGRTIIANDTSGLRAEVRTIFQNIKILAVGRDLKLATANVNRPVAGEEDLTNKNITVALKPEDVQKLVLAQSTGRITLALRRFNETDLAQLDYLDPFRAFGIKLPIVAGPQPAYREIRGGQVFAQPY